ncbi:MAG: FISUMP domain-containing protein [Bacteroidales bacterium]
MLRKVLLSCVLLIITVCLIVSCKKEKNEPAPDEVVIADNVSLIPTETWDENFVSIDSSTYTLTFSDDISSKMDIKTGDILVSTAGDGMLRKVTGVKTVGSQIEVSTEFASLVDAIEQGDVELDQPLYASQVKSIEYHVPGLKFKSENLKGPDDLNFSWDINSVIFDSDHNPGTINDQIKLEGDFSFNWRLVAKIKIGFLQGLKEVKFGVAASESLNLNLVASMTAALPNNLDIVLATVRFSPIYVYMGGIPVVLNPVMKIHVGVEGELTATITTGISQGLSVSGGIQYIKSKGWAPYHTFDTTFHYYLPQLYVNANVTAYLKPEFEMKVYGVGGPYVNMKLYGRFAAKLLPNPSFDIYGGISLGAGARIEIFDKLELDYSINEIFKAEGLLYHKQRSQPVLKPTVTSNVAEFTSVSALLGGNVTDDGGSLVTERGIYLGSLVDPANTGIKYKAGDGSGAFSTAVKDLKPNTTYYYRAYATNSKGTSYGDEMSFMTLSGLVAVDVDGNVYKTVTIGQQTWFSENLRTTKLNDGQAIPLVTANTAWNNLSTPGYCWYNNNQAQYAVNYGALYNWYAVGTNKLCPAGWHVASDNDFKILEKSLGMSESEADAIGFRGINEASKLAGVPDLWNTGALKSNAVFGQAALMLFLMVIVILKVPS